MGKCCCCGKSINAWTLYKSDVGGKQFDTCEDCNNKIWKFSKNEAVLSDVVTEQTTPELYNALTETKESTSKADNKDSTIKLGVEKQEDKQSSYKSTNEQNSSQEKSSCGPLIKVVSVIVGVLDIIGSIIIGYNLDSFAVAFAYGLVSLLFALLCFGIGEICERLTSIDNKMK